MRDALLVGLAAVVGCGTAPAPPPDPPLPEFTNWPGLTPQLVTLPDGLFRLCKMPAEQVRRGPHFVPTARYLVNPTGEAAVRGGPFPVPVGTTVVKVKPAAEGFASGDWYAAMVKREVGYDPSGGDWEYLTARHVGVGWVVESRGRLADCAGCHQQAADTDYLFRSYLDR